MSYVQDKTKTEILNELAGTAQPGSQIHEQQKAGIIVRCTEDIQVSLEKKLTPRVKLIIHLSNSI